MLEISHAQARRLIRRAADGALPEEQWNALQAHLESCADCRADAARLGALERHLGRVLRDRWGRVDGPADRHMAHTLLQTRARRARRRILIRQGVLGLLAAALLLALVLVNRARLMPSRLMPAHPATGGVAPPAQTATPTPSPSPTPVNRFQGLVAFTVEEQGKTRIDLLNASAGASGAADQSVLTPDGFQNQAPAWSPDGEWLAFLSDRGGSTQLYVINVAGTRLTQLTRGDAVAWQGPLSWSYDGQWIALSGRRAQDNARWIYLVPLTPNRGDGGGPRAVAGSRDTPGWARFSPAQPLLAVQRADGGIQVYHTELGWTGDVTAASRVRDNLHTGLHGAFTWTLDGLRLVYLADGPYVMPASSYYPGMFERPLAGAATRIIASQVIGPYARPAALDANQETLDKIPGAGALRALSYMPGGPLLATLQDPHNTGCWTLRLIHSTLYDSVHPVSLPGLCLLNLPDAAAWTPDGRWLVAVARPEDPATHAPSGAVGLYAVEVASGSQERLADAPAGARSVIAVRPAAQSLGLAADILEATARQAAAQSTPLPSGGQPPAVSGSLVYPASRSGRDDLLVRSSPTGAERSTWFTADAGTTCPALSPDGRSLAFLSTLWNGGAKLPYAIFVKDLAGFGNVRQFDGELAPYRYYTAAMPAPAVACPVWSPDGKLIAVVTQSGVLPRLDIYQVDGQLLRSIPIDPPSLFTGPVWSKDGKTIYLAEPAMPGGDKDRPSGYARVASIEWRLPIGSTTLLTLPGWDDVQALSISPDSLQLALLVVKQAPQDGGSNAPSNAALQIIQLPDLSRAAEMSLSIYGYDPQSRAGPGRIAWDAGSGPPKLTFDIPHGPFAADKAQILRFDGEHIRVLASLTDRLYGWVSYANWLVAATEGGVYGYAPGAADVGPYLIDPTAVSGIDGR